MIVESIQSEEGNFLHVHVSDSGIGIKAENIERLFELFSREEEGAQVDQSGVGLGLTICKTIVEQFGGTISVASVFGEGSTFSFSFGYAEEQEESGTSSPTSANVANVAGLERVSRKVSLDEINIDSQLIDENVATPEIRSFHIRELTHCSYSN